MIHVRKIRFQGIHRHILFFPKRIFPLMEERENKAKVGHPRKSYQIIVFLACKS